MVGRLRVDCQHDGTDQQEKDIRTFHRVIVALRQKLEGNEPE